MSGDSIWNTNNSYVFHLYYFNFLYAQGVRELTLIKLIMSFVEIFMVEKLYLKNLKELIIKKLVFNQYLLLLLAKYLCQLSKLFKNTEKLNLKLTTQNMDIRS